MKKHLIVLLILIANVLIFATYLSGWLWFDLFKDDPFPLYLILAISLIMPITLIGMFILLNKEFSTTRKFKWVTYVLVTSFIGSIHFYVKYKNDIIRIAEKTDRKMKEGPDSLSEFDSGSHRHNER